MTPPQEAMIYTLTLNPAIDRELTVPALAFDQVLRARGVQIDYGGKGFNVSRALLGLGVESVALGFIGGYTGEQMIAGLADLGVRADFVRIQGETRTNLSVVEDNHAHYLKVNEPGPVVTETESTALLKKIASLAKKGDWWILAGSLPPGIPSHLYARVIRLVQSAGAYAILDTAGDPLREGCAANAFLVKPNALEASELTGYPISSLGGAVESLVRIHKMGAQQVVISLGKLGGVYSDGTHTWWAEPPVIEERNPIGAGDAMVAGLAWAFQRGLKGAEVLRWGVACGAATASLAGTAMGSYPLVEQLVARVRVGDESILA